MGRRVVINFDTLFLLCLELGRLATTTAAGPRDRTPAPPYILIARDSSPAASYNSKASARWRTTTETRHRTRGKDRTEPPLAPALPLRGAGRKTRGRDRCHARRRGSRSSDRRPRFPRPSLARFRSRLGKRGRPPTRCARGGRGAGARALAAQGALIECGWEASDLAVRVWQLCGFEGHGRSSRYCGGAASAT